MEKRIKALRGRIEGAPRGTDGRRVFDDALRDEAVAIAKGWEAPLSRLAAALTLHGGTLENWVRRRATKPKIGRVREVQVESDATEMSMKSTTVSGPVVLLPSGIRVEGLSVAELIELVGALR